MLIASYYDVLASSLSLSLSLSLPFSSWLFAAQSDISHYWRGQRKPASKGTSAQHAPIASHHRYARYYRSMTKSRRRSWRCRGFRPIYLYTRPVRDKWAFAARPFKWKPVITRQRGDVSFLSATVEGLQIIASRRLFRVGVRAYSRPLSNRYAYIAEDESVYSKLDLR